MGLADGCTANDKRFLTSCVRSDEGAMHDW
jgi:hypothetical protein